MLQGGDPTGTGRGGMIFRPDSYLSHSHSVIEHIQIKRFLPRLKTTTAWQLIPYRPKFSMIEIQHGGSHYIDFLLIEQD